MEKKLEQIKKPKRAQQRVYDSNGYKLRVDCVCFKDHSKHEVLMVSSRNSEGCWTIPGGGLEPGETHEVAALREANEEAGIYGYVDGPLGTNVNEEGKSRTFAYSIIVTSETSVWEDSQDDTFINGGRQRRWFSVPDACRILMERGKHSKLQYFNHSLTSDPTAQLPVLLSNGPSTTGTSCSNEGITHNNDHITSSSSIEV